MLKANDSEKSRFQIAWQLGSEGQPPITPPTIAQAAQQRAQAARGISGPSLASLGNYAHFGGEYQEYRYELGRVWQPNTQCKDLVLFVGLNPSTADAFIDDPTIRRCVRFAKDWGFGGLVMANLFAYRATDPFIMRKAADPIGPKNDEVLQDLAKRCPLTVACWGGGGSHKGRDRQVRALIPDLHHLGLTAGGQPRHPLYLLASSQPTLWKENEE